MPRSFAVVAAILFGLLYTPVARAADYFTELEIDEIREAQEIDKRIGILLRIANIRLARLGLTEVEEDIRQTESDNNPITRTIVRILAPAAAAEMDKAREESDRPAYENDLSRFSRTELLRGYYQALEETMDNIDDAYERNRDIRGPLELLEDFAGSSLSALRKFEVANEAEEVALEDAVQETELAFEGAREALETIPKTERDR